MITKTFTSGRIRKADYNAETQQLDLHWDIKNVLAYKQCPTKCFADSALPPTPPPTGRTASPRSTPKATR